MSFSWSALHAQLLRSTCTRSFNTDFDDIRGAAMGAIPFRQPEALLTWLHATKDQRGRKNAVLFALVQVAQSETASSHTAMTLLLLALWPGLDAVHGRLCRHAVGRREELAGELLSRATLQIGSLDLQRVTRIAATVLRNIERDFRRSAIESRAAPDPDDLIDLAVDTPEDRLTVQQLLKQAGDDAALVVAVAVDGFSQGEAGERLGLRQDAARKRYQRAIARMRAGA